MQTADDTIAYLGPRGTHTEEIALGLPYRVRVPYPTIDAVIRAVAAQAVGAGVVPIENSIEGPVNLTLDMLAHEVDLYIIKEVIKPCQHHLLVNQAAAVENGICEAIKVIMSKDQALAQCRHYLHQHYPDAHLKAVESTAAAAHMVAGDAPGYAAVGSLRAADLHKLKVAARCIQDSETNSTRFVVIGKQQAMWEQGRYKTSLVSKIKGDQPGSLCNLLQEFSCRGVNLTKIESRPARTDLGEYIFFLDIEGRNDEREVVAAIAAVREKSLWFKNLGSYVCVHV